MGLALEHVNPMSAFCDARPIKRKAKLKRHVESGNPLRELDPGEVMYREVGLLDQIDDRPKAALARNSNGRINTQAKLG